LKEEQIAFYKKETGRRSEEKSEMQTKFAKQVEKSTKEI
jgi:hypothetical protein